MVIKIILEVIKLDCANRLSQYLAPKIPVSNWVATQTLWTFFLKNLIIYVNALTLCIEYRFAGCLEDDSIRYRETLRITTP